MSSTTSDQILAKVCRAIDILIEAGDAYDGLFPSLLDLNTHRMPDELPAPIPGQRKGDRSYPGNNLIHDEPVLKAMYALSGVCGREDYTAAADRYLRRFATHCTDTATGLFPWGEHSYWDLVEQKVGGGNPAEGRPSAIHDHLRQSPVWLWDKLYQFNPGCVERFAEGLDYHWQEGEPLEFSRHAKIEVKARPGRDPRSCDFARHAGFYILDWTYAYAKSGRGDFLEQVQRMTDYWWSRRTPSGLLPAETRTPKEIRVFYQMLAPTQTISLGNSLHESAALLDRKDPELAALMREQGSTYINGFLSAPHDLEKAAFVAAFHPDDDEVMITLPVWGSVYGIWPASYEGLTCLCSYRLTGDERLLDAAVCTARCYLKEPLPSDVAVPTMDSGLALELMADLYEITGEPAWLEGGLQLADKLLEVYLDGDLPRGAAGIDWYESQIGPGFLLHGLARIALLSADRENCPLGPDYTAR